MIGKKLLEALNKQVNAELYSGYLYISMAAYLESINLKGATHWMHVQAREEFNHAMRFFTYINAAGGRVNLAPIEVPATEWKSPLAVFENAYDHERKVTAMIHNLVKLAMKEDDFSANAMLQWFVTEQVEEEEHANEVVQKLKLVGDGSALFMVDQELGARILVPAFPEPGAIVP
jgi:ferritin